MPGSLPHAPKRLFETRPASPPDSSPPTRPRGMWPTHRSWQARRKSDFASHGPRTGHRRVLIPQVGAWVASESRDTGRPRHRSWLCRETPARSYRAHRDGSVKRQPAAQPASNAGRREQDAALRHRALRRTPRIAVVRSTTSTHENRKYRCFSGRSLRDQPLNSPGRGRRPRRNVVEQAAGLATRSGAYRSFAGSPGRSCQCEMPARHSV